MQTQHINSTDDEQNCYDLFAGFQKFIRVNVCTVVVV